MNHNNGSYVVGLMSGTSLDGIDAALVKITEINEKINVELIHYLSKAYSSEIKEALATLCIPEQAHIEKISIINIYLGEVYADITLQLIQEANLTTKDILLVSSHGQTIFHQPSLIMLNEKEIRSTLQIGDISVIAERTGIPVVGDFRTRDIAAGGQGAPLVPYGDYILFKRTEFGRVLVNIGGIANITVIPKDAEIADVFAYDTGPGNMMIDLFTEWLTNGVHLYDENGSFAAQGTVNQQWLTQLLTHKYFSQSSPKSTGREMFGRVFAEKTWQEADQLGINDFDKLTTITELTAITIATEIKKHMKKGSLKEVLISGGGRYNKTLMERINIHLTPELTVDGTEVYGMNADAKEAIIFALLGYQCFHKRKNNIPSATGAKNSVIMGKIAW